MILLKLYLRLLLVLLFWSSAWLGHGGGTGTQINLLCRTRGSPFIPSAPAWPLAFQWRISIFFGFSIILCTMHDGAYTGYPAIEATTSQLKEVTERLSNVSVGGILCISPVVLTHI